MASHMRNMRNTDNNNNNNNNNRIQTCIFKGKLENGEFPAACHKIISVAE